MRFQMSAIGRPSASTRSKPSVSNAACKVWMRASARETSASPSDPKESLPLSRQVIRPYHIIALKNRLSVSLRV